MANKELNDTVEKEEQFKKLGKNKENLEEFKKLLNSGEYDRMLSYSSYYMKEYLCDEAIAEVYARIYKLGGTNSLLTEFSDTLITEKNKWLILERIADGGEKFFKAITTKGSNTTWHFSFYYKKKEILNHYANTDLSTLPKPLAVYIDKLRIEKEVGAKNEHWKTLTDPDEIMKAVHFDIYTTEANVLEYFGMDEKNLDIFKKLLHSKYYTPSDVFNINFKICDKAKEELIKYSNVLWQEQKDVSKVLEISVRVNYKSLEAVEKLKYFYNKDKKIYNQLQERYESMTDSPAYSYKYSAGIMLDHMVEDKTIDREILLEFATRHIKSVEQKLKDPVYQEIYEEIEKRTNQPNWKKAHRVSLIMDRATKENKWEILEYFAANDVKKFKQIIDKFVKSKSEKAVYTLNEIFEKYKDADLTKLPKPLQEIVLKLIEKKKEQEEKKEASRWYDKDGNLLEFFKAGKIKLVTKEDYMKVVKQFLDLDISIVKFCRKYSISDEEGFRKVLKNFSLEDEELAKKIANKSEIKQAQYYQGAKKVVKEVCAGTKSVKDLIALSNSYDLAEIIELTNAHFSNGKVAEILVARIIEYYYKRLNSYTSSLEPENINKMLTRDEIKFIVGFEEYKDIMMGKKGDVAKAFLSSVSFMSIKHPDLMRSKVIPQGKNTIGSLLSKYNSVFDKKLNLKNQYTILKGDELVRVTPEIIDRAYQYAKANNIFPSSTNISMIIRSIINGKINNAEATDIEKENMIKQAKELVKTATSLDEYFKSVDELHKVLR